MNETPEEKDARIEELTVQKELLAGEVGRLTGALYIAETKLAQVEGDMHKKWAKEEARRIRAERIIELVRQTVTYKPVGE